MFTTTSSLEVNDIAGAFFIAHKNGVRTMGDNQRVQNDICVTNYKFRIRIDVCSAADKNSRVPSIRSFELYSRVYIQCIRVVYNYSSENERCGSKIRNCYQTHKIETVTTLTMCQHTRNFCYLIDYKASGSCFIHYMHSEL